MYGGALPPSPQRRLLTPHGRDSDAALRASPPSACSRRGAGQRSSCNSFLNFTTEAADGIRVTVLQLMERWCIAAALRINVSAKTTKLVSRIISSGRIRQLVVEGVVVALAVRQSEGLNAT